MLVSGLTRFEVGTFSLLEIRPGRPYTVPPEAVCCSLDNALIVQTVWSLTAFCHLVFICD